MKIGDFMRRAIRGYNMQGKLIQEPCTRASCRATRRAQARQFYRKPLEAAIIARLVARDNNTVEPAWVGMVLGAN